MKKIIYYVATSLDGYIAGPNEDISSFAGGRDLIDRYLNDLKTFETVIMGRKTYEFGYQFGLEPGKPAYPHMDHYIFSETLFLDDPADSVYIEKLDLNRIKEIQSKATTDIYLCSGGQFAGWLLDNKMIDRLKLKINPITQCDGARLFGKSSPNTSWKFSGAESFEGGLQLVTYDLN